MFLSVAFHFVHKVFIKIKEVIVVVMMEDVGFGFKKPATPTFKIVDKVLMVMVKVDIGLKACPLSTII